MGVVLPIQEIPNGQSVFPAKILAAGRKENTETEVTAPAIGVGESGLSDHEGRRLG